MSEHPIIFTGEMVKAILCGRKTQTRRIIKPQPNYMKRAGESDKEMIANIAKRKCPYGKVGDTLWVKEGYQASHSSLILTNSPRLIKGQYIADKSIFTIQLNNKEWELFGSRKFPRRKTSGRFMYRSLARIFLEITNIRVERIRSISKKDAKAEGVIIRNIGETYWRAFHKLWDSINAKRDYSWDKNPWVWIVEFKFNS